MKPVRSTRQLYRVFVHDNNSFTCKYQALEELLWTSRYGLRNDCIKLQEEQQIILLADTQRSIILPFFAF